MLAGWADRPEDSHMLLHRQTDRQTVAVADADAAVAAASVTVAAVADAVAASVAVAAGRQADRKTDR
jgi:hypothetical protein